jgi:hypothetical protein
MAHNDNCSAIAFELLQFSLLLLRWNVWSPTAENFVNETRSLDQHVRRDCRSQVCTIMPDE